MSSQLAVFTSQLAPPLLVCGRKLLGALLRKRCCLKCLLAERCGRLLSFGQLPLQVLFVCL
jgi:hypothetical protein